jgi:hypothetical protein
MEETGQASGPVVAHDQPRLEPELGQGLCLALGVLDDAADVRPGEGDDDADLHGGLP